MTAPNTWEYKVEPVFSKLKDTENLLEKLGKEDWELCMMVGTSFMIFKRHVFRTDI